MRRDSFTLIELLVVLAIVAILSVVVILTLNPAELLKQSRDSTRLSDISTLNTALSTFNTDVIGGFMGTSSYVLYISIPDTTSTCANLGLPALPTIPVVWRYYCVTATSTKNADGTGWIPVNFNQISFGSPLSSLPVDPINSTSSNQFYSYTPGSWKLAVMSLESQKFQPKTATDGGISDSAYEVGTDLTLAPAFLCSNGTVAYSGGPYDSNGLTKTTGGYYRTVQIGTQCWMKDSLNIGTRINGTTAATNNGTTEKYCYSNSDANCTTYGGLYLWDEAMGYSTTDGAQGICPSGWHVPKDSEMHTLDAFYASGSCVAGRSNVWDCAPANTALKATNNSSFNSLYGGARNAADGSFGGVGTTGYYWSSTQSGGSNAYGRLLDNASAGTDRYGWLKATGFSIRCIKG